MAEAGAGMMPGRRSCARGRQLGGPSISMTHSVPMAGQCPWPPPAGFYAQSLAEYAAAISHFRAVLDCEAARPLHALAAATAALCELQRDGSGTGAGRATELLEGVALSEAGSGGATSVSSTATGGDAEAPAERCGVGVGNSPACCTGHCPGHQRPSACGSAASQQELRQRLRPPAAGWCGSW